MKKVWWILIVLFFAVIFIFSFVRVSPAFPYDCAKFCDSEKGTYGVLVNEKNCCCAYGSTISPTGYRCFDENKKEVK